VPIIPISAVADPGFARGRLNGDLRSPQRGPREEPLVGKVESFWSIFIQKVAKS